MGGGSPSTSGMEAANAEAIALQRRMYEEGREDLQPWYKAGVGGVSKLSDLMGISGGSVMSREDMYQDLLPQYTSQETTGGVDTGMWTGMDGGLYDSRRAAQESARGDEDFNVARYMSPETTRDVINYEGLNTAVQDRLGSQATPEGYGSLLETFDMSKFEEDPGYQFRMEQGQTALERAMAAQGVTMGGGGYGEVNPQAARALTDYAQGMGSQEYGNAYNRYVGDQQNTYNRLMGISGMGQGSSAQLANMGTQYGQSVGNLQTGLANAQYQSQSGQPNKAMGAATGAMSGAMAGSMFGPPGMAIGGVLGGAAGAFSDERLKENIELVGHEMGHNIYEFDYKDGSGRYRGVMAQEVQDKEPEAVTEHSNGFLMVNYDKLGLKMEKVNGI